MDKLKYILLLLSLASVASHASPDSLKNLGSKDDFSGVSISSEFESPEDDSKESLSPDEDQHQHETLRQTKTFFIEKRTFNLAHGPAKRWDGCKRGYKTRGGFNSDSRCGRGYFHPSVGKGLNRNFHKCSFDAARKAGYPSIEKIFINHLGTYNDRRARNSKRLSNHAYARAMDIKNFNLVDKRGRKHKVSTLLRDYKGKQAKFYDGFRQCWKDSLPSRCRPGQREYKGSVGHKASKLGGNTLHNDHIHLAFPTCAG
jgi:hypothetical protein